MSKSVKRIFKIVGIAALGFFTFGAGAALLGGATLGTVLGTTVVLGGSAVALSTIATVGLAALSIGTLPDVPNLEKTGANKRGQAFLDPDALGAFVFGTTTVPLALVYERAVGENDEQVSNVFAHAWHRIESYEKLHIDGEEVTFSGDNAQGDWAGILTWKRANGAQSTALSVTGWGSSSVFAGVAHSSFTWLYKEDSEKLRGGIPTRLDVVVKGAWLYDPRLDSTVGGSGSQRLDDPTTWSFNNGNAALVLLRFLIGEYTPGGQLIWGRGAGYADIDMASFIAMANVADETVDSKPRYRLGGMHRLDGSFENFVKRWEQETGGKLAKIGGQYKVWLPHDDLVPLTVITQDKLANGPVQHTIAGDIRAYYNCARGRYIEPNEGYRGFPYPEVSEDTEIADDGSKCPLFQDFSWVQDVEIAQRVARIRVRRSRFQRIWTVPMGWEGQLPTYAPFTVHTLNIPETGNDPQLVRVIDRKMSMDGATILVLQQEDPSIYDETVPLGDPHASNTTGPRVYWVETVRSIGEPGPQGEPGEDAISVATSASNGLQFRQAPNGAWNGSQTDITFSWLLGGVTIATRVVRVTRTGATLTAALQSQTGDVTSHSVIGSGTAVVTIIATHTASNVSAAQSVSVVQSGAPGGNLLRLEAWTAGAVSGAVGSFVPNQTATGENQIINGLGPDGSSELLWEGRCLDPSLGSGGEANGGWANSGDLLGLDPTKSYRSTVWFQHSISSVNQFYHGCSGTSTANLDGTPNPNPYFIAGIFLNQNLTPGKWYLSVGIIHGSGYSGGYSGLSGIWDPETGRRAIMGTDFKMLPGATTQTHRTYMFYGGDTAVRMKWARPRFEIMDGNEVPLAAMLTSRPGLGSPDEEWTPLLVGVVRSGQTYTKVGGTDGQWDASVYSDRGYASCHVSFRFSQTNRGLMVGLNTDPLTDHDHTSLDYAFYGDASGNLFIYQSGSQVQSLGGYTTTEDLAITYDGFHVRFWRNNQVVRTVADAGKQLFLDTSFRDIGGAVNSLVFARGDVGKIDLATKVSGILSAAFAEAGLINQNISINADGTLAGAGGGQVSLPSLPGSVAVGQMTANVIAAIQAVVANLSAIRAELGSCVISTTGHLRSGASAFDGDGGWWLGFTGGEPALSFRSGSQYLRYRPSTGLEINGTINERGSFTGTLTGFTSTVQVTVEYQRVGVMVFLWIDANAWGTSNSTGMSLTGVPAALRPPTSRQAMCVVRDNSLTKIARCSLGSTGDILFDIGDFDGGDFTASGIKGLYAGWMLGYAIDP